ncbi:MAG: Signal peptidase I family protein [candidate division WWE3 bacterium GW2011_GWB1_44_4]|nr:MAG: Signal peptidase I family protein [candidate division WWE3 bacterium GW2011_GWA2_44_16]KKT70173.1 MAG: Signal peptidase I family protein [candidate division WWE3 bacterium GW2011_GWB1_44_4]KKT85029.1 MAG: Signal peptidase I family protein [candidate division WWE3 bacterium GW2011_GWC2_44_9]OGC52260.1 MAG: signal peptidase I [candidate division WWE3 bacterium RIFCSPHIGHO2_01_FULL_43_9]
MSKGAIKLVFLTVTLGVVCTLCVYFNVRVFFIKTGSMEPGIARGSLVFTYRSFVDIASGEVVVFFDSRLNTPVAHRVLAIHKQPTSHFITKGDTNTSADTGKVYQGDVIGKVFAVVEAPSIYQLFTAVLGFCLFYLLGVTLKGFLLSLRKHDYSCPSSAHNQIY